MGACCQNAIGIVMSAVPRPQVKSLKFERDVVLRGFGKELWTCVIALSVVQVEKQIGQ